MSKGGINEFMDALQAIFSRRSIRKYSSEPIAQDVEESLLRAAMVAPSALDERPWHFVVIRDRELLRELSARMDHCEMLGEAALGLLICGDDRLERAKGFWVQDCSACTQNVLLAAHALGLGAVWLAVHPLEDRIQAVRSVLGVPAEVAPFALVSLGYPAEKLEGEDRYDPSRIHANRW
jgi:nitroreductase